MSFSVPLCHNPLASGSLLTIFPIMMVRLARHMNQDGLSTPSRAFHTAAARHASMRTFGRPVRLVRQTPVLPAEVARNRTPLDLWYAPEGDISTWTHTRALLQSFRPRGKSIASPHAHDVRVFAAAPRRGCACACRNPRRRVSIERSRRRARRTSGGRSGDARPALRSTYSRRDRGWPHQRTPGWLSAPSDRAFARWIQLRHPNG